MTNLIETPAPYTHLAGTPVTDQPGATIDIDGTSFVIAPTDSEFEVIDPATGAGIVQGWPLSAYDYTAV